MAKQKFYVVWEGVEPGIYTSWNEASKQVAGYPNAKYKSFTDLREAQNAFKGSYWAVAGKATKTLRKSLAELEVLGVDLNAWATDAACAGNPGNMEYRGVEIATGRQMFHVGPLAQGTNNIGEFLAIVHALALLQKMGQLNRPIYTDSRNAISWVKKRTCRTKLEQNATNAPIFELIQRAEKWLALNHITNPILKWETEQWGEVPADFGRK